MFIKKKSLLSESLNVSKELEKRSSLDRNIDNNYDTKKLADKFNELLNKKDTVEIKNFIQKKRDNDIQSFEESSQIYSQNTSPEIEEKNDSSFMSLGDEILKGMISLQNNHMNTPSEIGENISISNLTSKEVASFISSVADRILVATKNVEGSAEVRISLKNDILPETEVRIVRDSEKLSVEFITFSQKSEELLMSHKGLLENHLRENLKFPDITVAINYSQRNDTFSFNSDGRSRGQRNIYEEMEYGEE